MSTGSPTRNSLISLCPSGTQTTGINAKAGVKLETAQQAAASVVTRRDRSGVIGVRARVDQVAIGFKLGKLIARRLA